MRVRGKVDVNARRRGPVRLQAKSERSRREQAAAVVMARAKARKVQADMTISASAHAPSWLSTWAGTFPASYQAWLAERANAHNNGWAFGHFRQMINVQLGASSGNETAGNSTEEQNESPIAQANENEGNENQGAGVTVTGNGNGSSGNETAGNSTEEQNESPVAQANENEGNENQGGRRHRDRRRDSAA